MIYVYGNDVGDSTEAERSTLPLAAMIEAKLLERAEYLDEGIRTFVQRRHWRRLTARLCVSVTLTDWEPSSQTAANSAKSFAPPSRRSQRRESGVVVATAGREMLTAPLELSQNLASCS